MSHVTPVLESVYHEGSGKLSYRFHLPTGLEFRGLLGEHLYDITMKTVETPGGLPLLKVSAWMRHPDRDTGLWSMMHQSRSIPANSSPDEIRTAIVEAVNLSWMHELHEGIWHDGQPLVDPHPEMGVTE